VVGDVTGWLYAALVLGAACVIWLLELV